MKRTALLFILLLIGLLCPSLVRAQNAQVLGPNVKVREGSIVVSARLSLSKEQVNDIEKGVPKELNIYIDLFRVWDTWPDEFVLGTTVTRTLRCDPVKKEFIATSVSVTENVERRFRSCESMTKWALAIPKAWLTNTSELAPGEYFVRVTVESRLRRLPPFINLLFFFVREVEFSVQEDSPNFPLNYED
jgi:hypothetical protein